MSKPSVFSKDYEKQMKKRRIRITCAIIITMSLVIVVLFYITDFNNFHHTHIINKFNKFNKFND